MPTQEKYEKALEGDMDLDKKVVKLGELHELAHEDSILSINASSIVGKMEFRLVKNAKSLDFPKGN